LNEEKRARKKKIHGSKKSQEDLHRTQPKEIVLEERTKRLLRRRRGKKLEPIDDKRVGCEGGQFNFAKYQGPKPNPKGKRL